MDQADPNGSAPDAEGSPEIESSGEDDAKIKSALAKLHRNLGYRRSKICNGSLDTVEHPIVLSS